MSIIIIFLPLFFLIFSSYLFNRNKLETTTGEIKMISLLEGVFTYLIIFIFFLQGFISMFGYFFIIVLLMLIIGYITFYVQRDLDREWDLQIETIKNNLVLFTTTILPIYLFLTIFRYLDIYLQISLTLLITALIFVLSLIAKTYIAPIFSKIVTFISEYNNIKFIYLWVFICLIITLYFLFDLPTNKISHRLNLSNTVRYYSFDKFSTNLNNHFDTKEIIKIDSKHTIDSKITDYYHDQQHLYLYTSKGELIIYDILSEEIVSNMNLGHQESSDDIISTEIYSKFTFYNDYLILLATNNMYLVNPNNTVIISNNTCFNTHKFYKDNELYYLKKQSKNIYNMYKFNDGDITLNETIDLSTTPYENLEVISENLFYKQNNEFVLYDNPSITFNIKDGIPTYDKERQIMYYAISIDYPEYYEHNTIYQKVEANGTTNSLTFNKTHNIKGVVIDNYIYFLDDEEMNNIEIMDSNFKMDAIYNHLELQPFWIGNYFDQSYIGNYKNINNQLEFIQIDQNNEHLVLTVQQLQDRKVDLKLPFYTYFGIGTFIPIIIAFFIPITNYRKSIITIDFNSKTKKK